MLLVLLKIKQKIKIAYKQEAKFQTMIGRLYSKWGLYGDKPRTPITMQLLHERIQLQLKPKITTWKRETIFLLLLFLIKNYLTLG